MVNYANGKIYKIVSDDLPNMCYIGSTTQILSKRLGKHKSDYKQYLKGNGNNMSSYELIKTGNAIIYLIQDCPCASRNELERIEGEFIREYRFDPTREMVCNRYIAGRTPKEYRQDHKVKLNLNAKQYHQDHKVKLNLQMKQYHEQNKVKRLIQMKQYSEDNKEKISLRKKQYRKENKERTTKLVTCPHCSRTIQHHNMSRHQKTKVCKSHQ